MKLAKLLSAAILAAAVTFTANAGSQAAVITLANADFESGTLDGWETLGNVAIKDASFGSGPADGLFQALLTTGGGSASASDMEAFLGLPPGAFTDNDFVEGSAIKQTFTANEDDVINIDFDWNFLVNKDSSFAFAYLFTDFFFLTPLTDTFDTQFFSSSSPFKLETGFRNLSFEFPVSGPFTVGIGVMDFGHGTSGLLVDAPIPEPSTFVLLGAGLAVVGICGRRIRRRVSG